MTTQQVREAITALKAYSADLRHAAATEPDTDNAATLTARHASKRTWGRR